MGQDWRTQHWEFLSWATHTYTHPTCLNILHNSKARNILNKDLVKQSIQTGKLSGCQTMSTFIHANVKVSRLRYYKEKWQTPTMVPMELSHVYSGITRNLTGRRGEVEKFKSIGRSHLRYSSSPKNGIELIDLEPRRFECEQKPWEQNFLKTVGFFIQLRGRQMNMEGYPI